MPWGRIALHILVLPFVLVVLFLGCYLALLLFLAKLPSLCCKFCRAVRWVPYVGLVYHGLIVPLVLSTLEKSWLIIIVGTALTAILDDWLLPNPFSFLRSPRERRAVQLAIKFLEACKGPRPNYKGVRVVGSEPTRTIVFVSVGWGDWPERRYLAVGDEIGSVEQIDIDYVRAKHNVNEGVCF